MKTEMKKHSTGIEIQIKKQEQDGTTMQNNGWGIQIQVQEFRLNTKLFQQGSLHLRHQTIMPQGLGIRPPKAVLLSCTSLSKLVLKHVHHTCQTI